MNPSLLERREELKLALNEENTQSLVDLIMNWVNRPFQKMIADNEVLSAILGALTIYLITTLVGASLVALLKESGKLQQILLKLGWWIIPLFTLSTISMVVANAFMRHITTILRDEVSEVVDTVQTLDDIGNWIRWIHSKKQGLLLGVIGGVVSGGWLVSSLNNHLGFSVGIGFAVMILLFAMQSSIFIGLLFAVLSLAIQMRRYHLILFSSDPSSSQIISTLSGLLSSFVYVIALYGAFITYAIIATGLLSSTYYALPIFWCLIVLIFAVNQYSLARIIQREKWKTLNAIQQQIQKIQGEQPVPTKDARETVIWLLDYHDRVKATRNSALNVRAGLNLLNSLLLPLLAFVLGNLDKIVALFH